MLRLLALALCALLATPVAHADITGRATVTNRGISPGGDVTAIVYEGFMDHEMRLPRVATSLERFFDPEYHRGGGDTEALLDLAPGTYTLRSVLADHKHLLHNPPVFSNLVTITVE